MRRCTADYLKSARLDDELKREVQDAWDFADQSPEPSLDA